MLTLNFGKLSVARLPINLHLRPVCVYTKPHWYEAKELSAATYTQGIHVQWM